MEEKKREEKKKNRELVEGVQLALFNDVVHLLLLIRWLWRQGSTNGTKISVTREGGMCELVRNPVKKK